MRKLGLIAVLFVGGTLAFGLPTVDGKVTAGEYSQSKKVIDGKATLNWSPDGKGGVFLALTANGKGWAGLGLGSKMMSGAFIYIGFVGSDGKSVFSEQVGKGHRHSDSGKKTADQSSVTLVGGVTTIEFHLAADKLPFQGKNVPFIAAFSNSADLVTFHEDSYDSGTFTLP